MSSRVPTATYRLQFHPGFTFTDANAIVEYLHSLGISDLYASPITMGGPEELNGYQVTDHTRLNAKLGTEEELGALLSELHDRKMGFVLDIVPNHMCIASDDNVWWNDILENGPSSPFARYFDIDWNPPRHELRNQVLLPILLDQFGRVLERGDLQLALRDGAFFITYLGRHLPLNPNSWTALLEPATREAELLLEPENPELMELQSIVTALQHLPSAMETDSERLAERRREKEIIKQRLRAAVTTSSEIRGAIGKTLARLNGIRGEPRSFNALEALLEQQCYRLSFWRVANHEINYRRFFDVNDLAGLRVEEFEVFSKVHELVFRLVRKGWVTGLRVDHIDGLFDPEQYLSELQQGCQIASESNTPFYIVVEKIFTGDERLRSSWPVAGTTGYDFLNLVNGLFAYQPSRRKLRDLYFDFGGWHQDHDQLIYTCKRYALSVALASEWHVLARHLDRVSEQDRFSRDFTMENLSQALRDVIACFPVYRTYVRASAVQLTEEDRALVNQALRRARRFNPTTSHLIYDFIQRVLLLDDPEGLTQEQLEDRHRFVVRFQQLTGPVMAKGVEDTAFYRAYPLCSLNEVGGEPQTFGTTVEKFHQHNQERLEQWPHSMLATSTHDTKRSEDVRSRINVLSEMAETWEQAILRWRQLNEPLKREVEGECVPEGNEEYLFYQTVVGSFPLNNQTDHTYVERIQAYMAKATKEAKIHTSWINPNEAYDRALAQFIEQALDPEHPFLHDLKDFLKQVVRPGLYNSLSQLVLKIASPGVPDFYQGSEMWDFSLVDPDNRRPVDYPSRFPLLKDTDDVRKLVQSPEDGRIKLYYTRLGLNLRRDHPDLFLKGDYQPLDTTGKRAGHLIAFSRSHGSHRLIALAGRFFSRHTTWGDTQITIPPGTYRDLYTGQTHQSNGSLKAEELLSLLPATLLQIQAADLE